jgi:tRNA A-37 threonylcarbamoyl transferase component Bud32/peptidoglycan hydrolase-like protein with peptidoglycan-binding domain
VIISSCRVEPFNGQGAMMSDDQADRELQARIELHGVLPPGTKLRGYELISTLGQGAFGITYRAVDRTLHREVAIKEYLPATLALREGRTTVLPRSPDHAQQFAWGRDRFLEEARTLARLERAPGIVRVYDFLEDNGTAYMVMALIEGETLARRLAREQRLMPAAVDTLLYPLLDGLEEFHAATFLHRDIKPANIMVDAGGKPTLIDFGASRAAMSGRSTTMTAIFTPGYAAAEQFIAASKLGPATDIYGLSATLYHAITGEIPPSAIERVMKDDYEALQKLQPQGYARSLLRGIDEGLAIRAVDRPQSIAEWRAMLGPASSGLHTTRIIRRPGRLPQAATRAGRLRLTLKGPALWASLAAAVLVLGAASYLAWINASPTITTAALTLSAEQLEQALGERRKADALAAEKRRLVEEARCRAETEAEANRRAESELQEARLARQKAESELAQLKADFEAREARRGTSTSGGDPVNLAAQRAVEETARRKAEEDTAVLREAESQAQTRATAEAESKRLADEALARAQTEQRQAEEEAGRKAEAEAAKRKADEQALQKAEAAAKEKGDADAQKKVAEAAERALRLEPVDRERLQIALTSLGFDTRGRDGVLGPRSREMIAAWQKARNQPETGFVSAAQQQALLKEAGPVVGTFDEELKKIEAEKTLAEQRRAPTATSVAAVSSPADGLWRGTYRCATTVSMTLEMRLANGSGIWMAPNSTLSNDNTVSVNISVEADRVTVTRTKISASFQISELSGIFNGNSIRATGSYPSCTLALTRVPEAAPTAGPYDGVYAANVDLGGYSGSASRFIVRLSITNSQGAGTMTSPGCSSSPFSVAISPEGDVSGSGTFNCMAGNNVTGLLTISGRREGTSLVLRFAGDRGGVRALRLVRQVN